MKLRRSPRRVLVSLIALLSFVACDFELDLSGGASPTPTPTAALPSPSPPPYYVGEIMSPLKLSKETWDLTIGDKLLVQVSGHDPEEHGVLRFYRISHPDLGEIVKPIDGAPAPNGQMYLANKVGSVKIEAEGRRCPPAGSSGRCATTELGSLFIYVKAPTPEPPASPPKS